MKRAAATMLQAGRTITRRVQLAFHTTDTVLALRLRAHYCGFPRFSPRAPFRVAPRARTPVHTANDFFHYKSSLLSPTSVNFYNSISFIS